jgi:cytochrome c biogenesis protein CcmG, thiol:disulfide interchange protein DsbE
MANRRQWIAVGVVLGVLAFGLGAAVLLTPEISRIEPGVKAPDYKAESLATSDSVALSSYRGQVVLLNIWATWCSPCEQEMPSMERLYQELGPEGLKVVAVSIDQTSSGTVQKWVQEHDLTFTVLHDASGHIQQTYQTTGYPESFVIDRSGTIVKKLIGATEWDHPAQKALFRRLLAAQ